MISKYQQIFLFTILFKLSKIGFKAHSMRFEAIEKIKNLFYSIFDISHKAFICAFAFDYRQF